MYYLVSTEFNEQKQALLCRAKDSLGLADLLYNYFATNGYKVEVAPEPICYDHSAKNIMSLFKVANSDKYWDRHFNSGPYPVLNVSRIVYKLG